MAMTKARSPLGERLKKLRDGTGLSQQELADKAGVTLSVLTAIEQGLTPDPRVGTLLALAGALGVDMNRLTEGMRPRLKKKRPRKGKEG
jgi:transcriptional regulator with XRE-family HTH domain